MAWEPMTSEEASKLLDAMPQAGSTDATRFARIVEAWMVLDGAPHDRIKAAVEDVLGRPVE